LKARSKTSAGVPMSTGSSPQPTSVPEECPQLSMSKKWVCRVAANDKMAHKTAAKIGNTIRSDNLFKALPHRYRLPPHPASSKLPAASSAPNANLDSQSTLRQ